MKTLLLGSQPFRRIIGRGQGQPAMIMVR